MWVLNPPGGYPGKTRFKGFLGRKCTGGLIKVFWRPVVLCCHRPGQSLVVRPRGCCKCDMQGRWVPWENSFSERLWVQESKGGVILTMVEQGYDTSVAKDRVKAQGCDPMGIIEGPCGYSTHLVGTQGTPVFRRPWAKVSRRDP